MNLYTTRPYYSEKTGEKLGERAVATSKKICDYTGAQLDDDDPETTPVYTISIAYNHDSEPDWDGENIEKLKEFYNEEVPSWGNEKYQIKARLFEGEYHFTGLDYGRKDYLGQLMFDWIRAAGSDTESPYYDCSHFAQCLRICRYNTLLKLLKEKKVTLGEVGLLDE